MLSIQYVFKLFDGREEKFELLVNPESLRLEEPIPHLLPEWTQLEFHQCPHCPLSPEKVAHCPVAVNIALIVERFSDILSFQRVEVQVITQERTITHLTTAQKAVSSLMGVVIAMSDCPLTHFFKPMARFHLPFAGPQETIWRAVSTFLLTRFYIRKRGIAKDWSMEDLSRVYGDIQKMNVAMAERIRAVSEKDAALNALIILDMFARMLPPVVDDSMDKLSHLFEPFLSTLTHSGEENGHE